MFKVFLGYMIRAVSAVLKQRQETKLPKTFVRMEQLECVFERLEHIFKINNESSLLPHILLVESTALRIIHKIS